MKSKFFILLFCVLFASCLPQHKKVYTELRGDPLSADELKYWMNQGLSFILIDIRPRTTYANGHIPGARNIPYPHIDSLKEKAWSRSSIIVIYDSDSSVQKRIREEILEMGYENVKVLSGGFHSWTYEIEKD